MSAVAYWTLTSTVEAAERVSVKVAFTVPVLPSVTVASLMRMDGGLGADQDPSLMNTLTLATPVSVFDVTAASGRPSRLKSPTARPEARVPKLRDWRIGTAKDPSPWPKSTWTWPVS